MRKLTNTNNQTRTRQDIEQIFAPKERTVFTNLVDKSQLREGERHIYKDPDDNIFFVTRVGNNVYYLTGYSEVPDPTEGLDKRYAFLMGI